jgi:hypothetical protein
MAMFQSLTEVEPGSRYVEALLLERLPHHPVGEALGVTLPGEKADEPPDARGNRLASRARKPPGHQRPRS